MKNVPSPTSDDTAGAPGESALVSKQAGCLGQGHRASYCGGSPTPTPARGLAQPCSSQDPKLLALTKAHNARIRE